MYTATQLDAYFFPYPKYDWDVMMILFTKIRLLKVRTHSKESMANFYLFEISILMLTKAAFI